MPDEGMPWGMMMEVAFGALGMAPDRFWQMTPPEWMAALKGWKRRHGGGGVQAIGRRELESLMRRFPD